MFLPKLKVSPPPPFPRKTSIVHSDLGVNQLQHRKPRGLLPPPRLPPQPFAGSANGVNLKNVAAPSNLSAEALWRRQVAPLFNIPRGEQHEMLQLQIYCPIYHPIPCRSRKLVTIARESAYSIAPTRTRTLPLTTETPPR